MLTLQCFLYAGNLRLQPDSRLRRLHFLSYQTQKRQEACILPGRHFQICSFRQKGSAAAASLSARQKSFANACWSSRSLRGEYITASATSSKLARDPSLQLASGLYRLLVCFKHGCRNFPSHLSEQICMMQSCRPRSVRLKRSIWIACVLS